MIELEFAKTIARSSSEQSILEKLMAHAIQGHLCFESNEELKSEYITELQDDTKTFATPIGRFQNRFYLQKNWVYETKIVQNVKRILGFTLSKVSPGFLEKLTDEQANAVKVALSNPFSLISGGPGRGKSFTAAEIVRALGGNASIIVTAPTGKATAHLRQSILRGVDGIQLTCKTLHSLLGVSPHSQKTRTKRIQADLIIVDESSMIDAKLFALFLEAIGDGSRLILMGDDDQLPPVDVGTVFAELCQIESIPHVQLTKCMRSDLTEILQLADSVNSGDGDATLDLLKKGRYKACKNPSLQDLHLERFPTTGTPDELLEAFGKYKILSSLRKGPYGTQKLNECIATHLCEKHGSGIPLPIIITKSDEELGLSNGECGVKIGEMAYFATSRVPVSLLPFYELAFVISIHKSQGSEYDHVLLLLLEGTESFGREILYTGITRARYSVEVISDDDLIRSCCVKASKRISSISLRFSNSSD